MALICIIIGLILERTVTDITRYRHFDWFDRYSDWLIKHLPGLANQGSSSIVILLLPVMLLTASLQNLFDGALLNLFSAIFGLIIFLYCLGPGDLNKEIDLYLDARENGDEEQAQNYATAITGDNASSSPDRQIIDVMHAILYQSNDRFFAVIFWFVILGPFGALLYRLTSHTKIHATNITLSSAAKRLQAILAWAPAHLVAMGYALTGNYEAASSGFREKQQYDNLNESNYYTLLSAGLGALRDCAPGEETSCIVATRELVLRTLVVWLATISALTLIGWMA
jgi:membrane protein required for beta-lactamase induction